LPFAIRGHPENTKENLLGTREAIVSHPQVRLFTDINPFRKLFHTPGASRTHSHPGLGYAHCMLLVDPDRSVVERRLAAVTRPVTILSFTQTVDAPEPRSLRPRLLLDEVAGLHELIALEEVNVVLDKGRAALYGIQHVPAIVLLGDDEDTRIRFLGAPAGYEFLSLVEALVLAGTGDSGLSPASRTLIAEHVREPTHVRVFVTPSCAHCPRAVTLAHRMAIESPHIEATCVDATEFVDLSRKYRVNGVPKTVVNDAIEILGALPEEEFVRTTLGIAGLPKPG